MRHSREGRRIINEWRWKGGKTRGGKSVDALPSVFTLLSQPLFFLPFPPLLYSTVCVRRDVGCVIDP